jgi:hypothetical protein
MVTALMTRGYSHSLVSLAVLVFSSVGAFTACAKGATGDLTEEQLPTGAAATEDAGATVTIPMPATPDSNVEATPDAGTSDADADVDPVAACVSPNKCSSASDLGTISGDTGAGTKKVTGHTSTWFRIRVTEGQVNSLFDLTPLKLNVKLTSPPGSNYDLLVYVPKDDSTECSAVTAGSTSPGTSDSAAVQFGDETIDLPDPLGTPDDRSVTIEVRHVSGPCDPAKPWTLDLFGNK